MGDGSAQQSRLPARWEIES